MGVLRMSLPGLSDALRDSPATASALRCFEALGWGFFDASPGHFGARKRFGFNLIQLESPTLGALIAAVSERENDLGD